MQATSASATVGSQSVYFGPMGSGKTTRALEQASQFCALGFRTTYVTSKLEEQRADLEKAFYSHNSSGASLPKLVTVVRCETLPHDFGDAEVVIIDEAQFFSNLVETVKRALRQGKNLQVYGLASDFKGDKFGSIIDLIPFADTVVQMTAKCIRCSQESRTLVPAAFTDRQGKGGDVVKVGGLGEYLPVCRKHHTKLDAAVTEEMGQAACCDTPIWS